MADEDVTSPKRARRVVVIDDEPAFYRFTASLIEGLGFEVITALDASSIRLHEL